MIDLTKEATVFIGRRGEHHYRHLEFDVSSLLDDTYPGDALSAIYKRPDGVAYPVLRNYANGVLTWSPSATDTSLVGVGRLEIRVTYGDVVGKSVRILTIVEEALADGIAELFEIRHVWQCHRCGRRQQHQRAFTHNTACRQRAYRRAKRSAFTCGGDLR